MRHLTPPQNVLYVNLHDNTTPRLSLVGMGADRVDTSILAKWCLSHETTESEGVFARWKEELSEDAAQQLKALLAQEGFEGGLNFLQQIPKLPKNLPETSPPPGWVGMAPLTEESKMFVLRAGGPKTVKERVDGKDVPIGDLEVGKSFTVPRNKWLVVPRDVDVVTHRPLKPV